MEPYRLVYRLITPLILGAHPITLDALAYAALFSRSGDEDWSNEQLKYYFKMTHGIPHASALAFGRTRQHSLIARSVPVIGGLRSARDFSSIFIKPNGRYDSYSKVRIDGGPYKFRFNSYRGYWSPYICFDFCGDRDRVEALLSSFVIGVGARAQIGSGEVVDPQFIPQQRDLSLFDIDSWPSRPLPLAMYEDSKGAWFGEVGKGCCHPPYWRDAECPVVNPERVRIVNL